MQSATQSGLSFKEKWRGLGVAALCIGAVLGVLFYRSFLPGQVLFSNDGPLGAISARAASLPGTLFGYWQDLNWIGLQVPSASPDFSVAVWLIINNAVTYAKFFVPIALLFSGAKRLAVLPPIRFSRWTSVLGSLAVALNMNTFSNACWGLPTRAVTLGAFFLALAALQSRVTGRPLIKAILAGLAVGLGVMEGFDVGAIFSLYIAAFVLFSAFVDRPLTGLTRGLTSLMLVTFFAAFIAACTLSTLIGTQVKGIVGTQQDQSTKDQRWDEATMWSLPKLETLRVIIPGLFGYRMDTPGGGNYWGAVGQQPGWEEHHQGQARHSGSGEYAGVLVVLIAGWAAASSFRKRQNPYSAREIQYIWFWMGAALLSLLFAFGRHAPFYRIIYALPYFSTIRNPIKFMHPFHLCMLVLFGYGLEGLFRSYLCKDLSKSTVLGSQFKGWWSLASVFEKRWTRGSLALAGLSLVGLLLYFSSRSELERHLQAVGFAELAGSIASYSNVEVFWFVLFLALGIGCVLLISSGALSGRRHLQAGILLGTLLVIDLGRADTHWIIYYDYKEKYAANPIIDLLRKEPFEHRVAARLSPLSPNYLASEQGNTLLRPMAEEWLQHHFQFYNVQSLDIVQMPRMPELDATYLGAILSPGLSLSDFTQPDAFLSKLTNHTDAVSQFLWEQFSPELTNRLLQAKSDKPVLPIVKDELNRALHAVSLYEPNRFAGVKLSEETRAVLNQGGFGRDLFRANRLLLAEAYPGEVSRGSQFASVGRLWQLTNTKYILGMKGFLDLINQQIDTKNHSFRVEAPFEFAPRATAANGAGARIEDITALIKPNGPFAVFNFGAALPRVKLYSEWQVITNDTLALQQLADLDFDPQRSVVVANALPPTAPSLAAGQTTGSVSFVEYAPKRIHLRAAAPAPSVLLLNDRFDASWKVRIDGKDEPLLRCNYIMQGVLVPAGKHEIEFAFDPPHWALYVSLAAIAIGLGLCGVLFLDAKPPRSPARPQDAPALSASKSKI